MTDLLRRLESDLALAGLVNEGNNGKIVFLVASSAALRKPLNLTICGASAAGKNHIIECVAKLIPEERRKFLTGMTPKALMHTGENEYQHKAVFIAEYEGVHGADYPIRTFQSEQRIDWEYVDTAAKDGMKTKRKSVLGPAAFVQATTRVSLHPENETRLLFIHIDQSPEQTQAINRRQAQVAAGKAEHCPEAVFKVWHQFFGGLHENRVVIPFAEQLAAGMPIERLRSRRDFPKLLALIEASAYLHQGSRARDSDGVILAGTDDYQIARALFESCYDTALDRSTAEFLDAFKEHSEGSEFTVTQLMQKTGWRKSKSYDVLARLEDSAIVSSAEQRGRYVLERKKPELKLRLPAKIRLTVHDFHISAQIPPNGVGPETSV